MELNMNILLSKFDNGLELYQNNSFFNNAINNLLQGGDIYKIFEQIIVMQQETQKRYEEIFSSGKIRTEIFVKKEEYDKIYESIVLE